MNLDFVEALHLVQQLGVLMKNRAVEHTDVVVAPPFVDLRSVSSVIDAEKLAIGLGAQHVNPYDNGAHTGEISTGMLSRLNVAVGHRRPLGASHALRDGPTTSSPRHYAASCARVSTRCSAWARISRSRGGRARSLRRGPALERTRGLEERFHPLVTVAYEPLWAIGTGVNATSEQVHEMNDFLRTVLSSLGLGTPQVLYGGSVNPDNAASLVREGRVDGFLVGGASLKAESFYAILRACDDCYAIKR